MALSLQKLSQQDKFILHINHAGILIKNGGNYLLCDPWYISPAFGNWTQNPSPPAALIEFILSIDQDKLGIAISHGHDDHLDDFFVRHHLKNCSFFVPEFPSPGLVNRISAVAKNPPVVLTDEPVEWRGFRLSRIVNEDFTGYDSIINIETDGFTVIHANDNWHHQPPEVISILKSVKERSSANFYYFSQLGIADCFPLCYPQYSETELHEITNVRVTKAIDALRLNMQDVGITSAYTYANQSKVQSHFAKCDFDNFSVAHRKVDSENDAALAITQCMPGDYLLANEPNEKLKRMEIDADDLLVKCLKVLEQKVNAFSRKSLGTTIDIKFDLPGGSLPENTVLYATDRIVWQNILTGNLNLEAIGVGGAGTVMKNPKDTNIRDVHHALSKYAYIAQAKFKATGLSWLLKQDE